MRKTFYSPLRWIHIVSAIAVPLFFYVSNSFRSLNDLWGTILRLIWGCVLVYLTFRFTNWWITEKLGVIPYIKISDNKVLIRRNKSVVETEIANIQQIKRVEKGNWLFIFRESVHDSQGTELQELVLGGFPSWRKSKWREVLGKDIEIMI